MILSGRKRLWLVAGLGCACLFRASLPAQTMDELPAVPAQSPVAIFRQLLQMKPDERKLSLASRSPEIQERLLKKVREYESLQPEIREARLEATELRWYLLPLMTTAPTNRVAQLELIPPAQREVVKERLQTWDILPPELQQILLNNEMTIRYLAQVQTATEEQKKKILQQMSPERRAKLEEGIDRWRSLSDEERSKELSSFSQFFDLSARERQSALNTLSPEERLQMAKTLQAYSSLSPAQREVCIRSFEKFASLSLTDRQLFLKNAERWELMTPAERESWRNLVNVAPIMPVSIELSPARRSNAPAN